MPGIDANTVLCLHADTVPKVMTASGTAQIDTALEALAHVNDRVVRVVECRYFGGLTIPETAEALGVSHTTVSEDWRFARAWLHRALTQDGSWKATGG